MYDQAFAQQRKRAPIPPEQHGRCLHCTYLRISTGSQYEWPCLILEDWICETHCAEVQLRSYSETRKKVAQRIGWKDDPKGLLEVCRQCPYFEGHVSLLKGLKDPEKVSDPEKVEKVSEESAGEVPERCQALISGPET
jgi:hypothetical protein